MKQTLAAVLRSLLVSGLAVALLAGQTAAAYACTGIRLTAGDGSVVYGRTMEWGAFDLHSRLVVIPRGQEFTGLTPDGLNGRTWTSKYGVVALDMLEREPLADGMNEAGLAAGLFYHPGFAQYPAYDPAEAANSITAVDVVAFILTQFATVDEVRAAMSDVRVVPVIEESLGIQVDGHWMVTDASGKSLVIEFFDGAPRFFDNPLGVLTNAPTFDWHMTNLRNYVNLSAVAMPTRSIEDLDFSPLGAGSGMIGLPGDSTPPSRFVRAVAWTQTARPTPDAEETIYETFRILDNFNLPLGSAEGADPTSPADAGMRSATIWTTAWDLENRVLYYHTQHDRRVRMLRLDGLDFDADVVLVLPLDREKTQDVLDVTPPR